MSATPDPSQDFQHTGDAARLIGATVETLGGEHGVLALLVDWAVEHGSAGALPFTAVVVRDGVVIGAGANTALSDFDRTSHGEVVAIRDATRRSVSADLGGTIVYSSCEPCAICRTVSAAAGVLEIVFAAGRESIPTEMDPAPQTTHQLMDAVSEILPRIARRGVTELSAAQLAAPFRAYLDAVARRSGSE
jgi:tRNA(Arg) A34 adenosine deaminase TadA